MRFFLWNSAGAYSFRAAFLIQPPIEYRSRQKIADNFLERYNAHALSCREPRLLDNLLKSTPRWESVSSLRRSRPKRRPDTSAPALRRFEAAPYMRSLETIHH